MELCKNYVPAIIPESFTYIFSYPNYNLEDSYYSW